jgi:deazaflavin-dependent oxidoreductase (nitroreductase family)
MSPDRSAAGRRPPLLDSAVMTTGMKYAAKAQTQLYQRTNGRVGGTLRLGAAFRKPVPLLLLDHVGRTSGRRFTTPLVYLAEGADLVVVASQGGMATHPQWYRNLLATPDTQVQVGAELRLVRARVAGPEERAALWPRLVELYADFDSYQSWTERQIPVVVLEPR